MHNVGVSTRSTFIENNEVVHRQVMELNLFAPWILTHDVLPGKNVQRCSNAFKLVLPYM